MGALRAFFSFSVSLLQAISDLFTRPDSLFKARFARSSELSGILSRSFERLGGLLLGAGPFGQVLSLRSTPFRRELGNLVVVAPTRGGKGLLAVSQLLSWPQSVVINDIKGELFAQTAGYRSTLGPVFVIDPTGIGNRSDPLTGRKTEDELLSSVTQLLYQPEEGEGRIFTQRATVMLTQLFLAARLEGKAPLPYVRQLIRMGLLAAARRLNSLNPVLATQFLDIEYQEANFSDRFLLSAWGTLSARMRLLLTETVVRSLAGADFTPSDLMRSDKPVTVYFRWPERDL